MTIEPTEIAELEALLSVDETDLLDQPPELADEAKATALLGVLGELEREHAEVDALYDTYRRELVKRIEKLDERQAERQAPLVARIGGVVRWLEGWHRAQVYQDERGRWHRLTVHLPTGSLKLRAQQPEIEVEEPERAMAWASEHAEGMVVTPEPRPVPPRLDGKLVRSFCMDALNNLPEEPAPGSVWTPIPGVQVTVRDRKFSAETDI